MDEKEFNQKVFNFLNENLRVDTSVEKQFDSNYVKLTISLFNTEKDDYQEIFSTGFCLMID